MKKNVEMDLKGCRKSVLAMDTYKVDGCRVALYMIAMHRDVVP